MIARLAYVMCDRCGTPAAPADDAVEARIIARWSGFKRIRRKDGRREDICEDCRKEINNS